MITREEFERAANIPQWIIYGEDKNRYRLAPGAHESDENFEILNEFNHEWYLWQACAAHYEAELEKVKSELHLATDDLIGYIQEAGRQATDIVRLEAERNSLLALIAEKDKALQSFAACVEKFTLAWEYDEDEAAYSLTIGDYRRAAEALYLTNDSVRLVPIKWEARTSMDGSYFPGAFVPITEEQYNSEEWAGFERRVLYTIVKGE